MIFTYAELNVARLKESYDSDHLVTIVLDGKKAKVLRNIIESFNKIYGGSFSKHSAMKKVTLAFRNVFLILKIAILYSKLMHVMGFYIEQKPKLEIFPQNESSLEYTFNFSSEDKPT